MKKLICPISDQRVDENIARLTGFQVAILLTIYINSQFYPIIMLVIIDYFLRTVPKTTYSPLSWIASRILKYGNFHDKSIDRAPKLFAARVGFLFSACILVLHIFYPLAGIIVTVLLLGFALLESLLNLCVGCLVYTYWVFPFFEKERSNHS